MLLGPVSPPPSSPPPSSPPASALPRTLVALLDQAVAMLGERPFVHCRGRTLAATELAASARRLAARLRCLGLAPGDRFAIYLEHVPEVIVALFAGAIAGAITVVVNARLKDAQVQHVLADSGARVLLTSPGKLLLLDDAPAALRGHRVLLCGAGEDLTAALERCSPELHAAFRECGAEALEATSCDAPAGCDEEAAAEPLPSVAADQPAVVFYTSGSTGLAKGVVQDHGNLVLGAEIVAGYLGLGPRDHVLSCLPFSFDYGLNQVLSAAHVGCPVTLLEYVAPGEVFQTLAAERCTGLAGVPPFWSAFAAALRAHPDLAAACATLRYVTNSGGRLALDDIHTLRGMLPHVRVFSMYGLTEAFRSAYLPPEEIDRRPASIGKAIPGVELLVVDPDTATPCPPGEVGELVHTGALVAKGYWNRPEDTARVFRTWAPSGRPAVWSGDLVRADAEGFLYWVARRDAQLKVRGHRVSPDEVEQAVRQVPGVGAAAVIGLPGGPEGDRIVAVVTAAPPPAASELVARVLRHCRRVLPAWMVPAAVQVVAELPTGPHGKVDLVALRATFGAPGADSPAPEFPAGEAPASCTAPRC